MPFMYHVRALSVTFAGLGSSCIWAKNVVCCALREGLHLKGAMWKVKFEE